MREPAHRAEARADGLDVVRFQSRMTATVSAESRMAEPLLVPAASASTPILPMKSAGSLAVVRPRRSLICEVKMMIAIPAVNPMVTG